jgi:hypothetical protein
MAVRTEVTVVRLYVKVPGTSRLRKGAAAQLHRLTADGWQETKRVVHGDYVLVRLERPVPPTPWTASKGRVPRSNQRAAGPYRPRR